MQIMWRKDFNDMTKDKELQYQARITELREALDMVVVCHSDYCEGHVGVSAHSYELARIAKQALSRSDDLSALEAYVREEKRKSAVEVLLGAATICSAADKSTHPSDLADIFKRMAKELK